MRRSRIIFVLLSLALISFAYLSTLARFTDEYTGFDSALVAKWNFGAMGEDDSEFYNKGFTFDLFDAHSVKPMDCGQKSFVFTGGGSDTGIVYDVEMNLQDLLMLAAGTVAKIDNVEIYAPIIFRITAAINEGATDAAPFVFTPVSGTDPDDPVENDSGWFRPGDIEASMIDEDGFFSIFDHTSGRPFFSPGSGDQVTITVSWQWNTSFYINDTEAAGTETNPVEPDTAEGSGGILSYYQAAYDAYYGEDGLNDKKIAAAWAVMNYLAEHGGLPGGTYGEPNDNGAPAGEGEAPDPEEPGNGEQGAPDPGEEGGVEPEASSPDGGEGAEPPDLEGPEGGDSEAPDSGGEGDGPAGNGYPGDEFDYEYYNYLVGLEYAAIEACETSLMAAYDDYDTLAVDALLAKESVKVIFRIKGDQISPGQN